MNLAGEGRPARAEAVRTIHAALEAGVRLIDVADVYGLHGGDAHHGEALVAEALASWPGEAWVATKGGVRRTARDPAAEDWVHQGDPAYLRRACEASLAALGVEAIDLYFLHAVDARVPIEESVGALAALRREGKVRRLGVSNVSAAELARARREAPIVAVQNEASPFVAPEPALLEACEAADLAFLAYAPLGGWRAGRIAHEAPLRRAADALGATPHEVALAWLLGTSPSLVAVAGATKPENARSSARAARLRLSAELRAALDAAYRPAEG
ncbi:MAG: aldo/keto reductase [Sandaracinus sp.]|nr:aldo/keto reductase [Sandaracinus sp.]MBJ71878.1 aldo/keto reductase [Sandaracinus sp.]